MSKGIRYDGILTLIKIALRINLVIIVCVLSGKGL